MKKHSLRFPFQTFFLLLVLQLIANSSIAEIKHISFFGETKLNGDTIHHINLLAKLRWDIQINDGNKNIRTYLNCKPDTLDISGKNTIVYKTSFVIDPALLNKSFTLFYNVLGSVIFVLNSDTITKQGVYATDKKNQALNIPHRDYLNVIFHDTIVNISITYLPHPQIQKNSLSVTIGDSNWSKSELDEKKESLSEVFGVGFFFLAFAIIFLILYLYVRVNSENLYFAVFCFFVSMTFLSDATEHSFFVSNIFSYAIVFAIEFLSIFFAKILLNRQKSKIPLLIICIIYLISFHPAFLYGYVFLFFGPVHLYLVCSVLVLITYAGISMVFYLVQGFKQKRWEAKAIAVGCSIALFVNVIIPGLLPMIFSSNYAQKFEDYPFIAYIPDIGLCMYPLTVAIVLGRRNGRNHKQLIDHVKSIEKLSHDNLEKEKEKKIILENQKAELETKVLERTQEVLQQKEVIEIKNKEITDNLTYAKRIQSAILPDLKIISKALPQSFILFLPKDIVSGDFYAFAQKENRLMIACADCTGHGVAGAFMSMIGSSLLNQIVNDRGIISPAEILNQLNTSIIFSLKQTENESHDGMDISICSFDLINNQLHFASANRPLWMVRNNELQIIKPDKFPIGGLQVVMNESFTNHTIQLQKGDTIYLFTDGFADQFGGINNKKMMTAKFKEQLLSIQHLNMSKQENYLRGYFEKWKGVNEQVDDVLVVGIRV